MNKSELIATVANRSGVSKKDAERVVNATIDAITASLAKGDKVLITGFGTFEVKNRSPRVGSNRRSAMSSAALASCKSSSMGMPLPAKRRAQAAASPS